MNHDALSHKSVYLIEDDIVQRNSLESLLRARGYTTFSFGSSEAFHSRPRLDRMPGCILLDFFLGGQDGLSFLKIHRERVDAMPVIVLTGHADVSVAVNFMKAGASTFLVKPYDADELLDCVDQAINWDQSTLDARLKSHHVRKCLEQLSERQKALKNLVLMGAPNKVSASQLELSERTIELERAEILKIFGVKNAIELAVLITQSQLPVPPFTLHSNSSRTAQASNPAPPPSASEPPPSAPEPPPSNQAPPTSASASPPLPAASDATIHLPHTPTSHLDSLPQKSNNPVPRNE